MGPVKQKSDRDQVRAEISAGGWEVAWGDLINEADIATAAIAGFTGGVGLGVWVEQQLQAQMLKFGKSIADISPRIRDQAMDKVQDIVKHARRGEWNIGGLGIKAGIATYHRWWKFRAFGGWQKLPNNYQPYIGFRLTSPPAGLVAGPESMEIEEVPNFLAESGPTQGPLEPPPSPIGTWEDISLGLTDEEVNSLLAKEEQMSLPVAAHA
jgi:hypothetical protein